MAIPGPRAERDRPRLAILESPYAGAIEKNLIYARRAVRDSLARGEAPIASHLLYTQAGILDDQIQEERDQGIAAGVAWYSRADLGIFYLDRGLSRGMAAALALCQAKGIEHELRFIGGAGGQDRHEIPPARPQWFNWEPAPMCTASQDRIAEQPLGRLQVRRSGRAPTAAAPFQVTFCGKPIAHYCSMQEGMVGAELFYAYASAKAPA